MTDLNVIAFTAATLGLVHTLIGPDHYLPFVMIGRAQKWSWPRLLIVTASCGVGHVLSSIVLGLVGVAAGMAVDRLEAVEGARGDLASWLLIAIGLVYAAWGIRKAWRSRPHTHLHQHEDGAIHGHDYRHYTAHAHPHTSGRGVTLWWLFIVFILGPCEPLIPLIMYPAAQHSLSGVILVAALFGLVTVATMTAITSLLYGGVSLLPLQRIERWSHAAAGLIIAGSGLAVKSLGL